MGKLKEGMLMHTLFCICSRNFPEIFFYSATFVESQQAAVESQHAVESTVSTTVVSASFAVALLAALLPQAAKEIAAKAANAKTNFFIFFTF